MLRICLASLAFVGMLSASSITETLGTCNAQLCGVDGIQQGTTIATITATDTSDGLSINVETAKDTWLLWDTSLFAFNGLAGGTISGLPSDFTWTDWGNKPRQVDGMGTFQYTINGPTAGGLALNGLTNLSFVVSGLTVADIIPNDGHEFAAHIGVILSNGSAVTGFAGGSGETPEPATWGIVGVSLILLAARLKKHRVC